MSFEIAKSTLESGVLMVAISGRMTIGIHLQKLESTIEEAIKNNQNKIVLDMSMVPYLDSSAIGTIVGCSSAVKNSGGQLRLAGVQDRIRTIFKMTNVDRILHLDASRVEAILALTGESA